MPEFITKLNATRIGTYNGRGLWQLNAPLVYISTILRDSISVHAGFITDYASVPRIPGIWWIAGALADEAAALHDYLYHTRVVTRKVADRIFLEAMKASGVSAWRRYAMYYTVRALGWRSYGREKVIVDVGSD